MATAGGPKMALKHYKAYQKNPLPTAIIDLVDAQTYHVTTRVTTDGFSYDLHWILKIPDTYPFLPPLGNVAPGFHASHRNIFKTGICNNFLGNHMYMHSNAADGEGWTPSTDFCALMMVLQDFFNTNEYFYPRLVEENANYCCPECHYGGTPTKAMAEVGAEVEAEVEAVQAVQAVQPKAACGILHTTIDDDVLGYPVILNEHELILVPEYMSYTAYIDAQTIARVHSKKAMRTALGQPYQFWLPLYCTAHHFEKALPHFEAMMLTLANSLQPPGKWKDAFQEEMVFEILTKLLISLHHHLFILPNNEPLLSAYGAFVQLYRRCFVRYSSMHAAMLRQVEAMEGLDLPTLVFMMSLVGAERPDLTYTALKQKVLAKHLQRQVQHGMVAALISEMIKRRKATLFTLHTEYLAKIFDIFRQENQMLIMVLELTCMFNEPTVDSNLDKFQGVLPLAKVEDLQRRIQRCKAVCDYAVYNDALHLDIRDARGWRQCFKNAYELFYKNSLKFLGMSICLLTRKKIGHATTV